MIYRRRPSPLQAARATVGLAWCVAVSAAALAIAHPLVLGVLLVAVLVAAAGARLGREVTRAALYAIPFGLLFAAISALANRKGLTVLVRGGEVPVLGNLDITLEAVVDGARIGLQVVIVIAVFALHSAAVDPDDLLRALRRFSLRTGLTAALATRLVPVLARDAHRLADAQRCRPGASASRLAIVRAVSSNALDRAVDVAATLEVRGYGGMRRLPVVRRPWSRHDLAFAASAVGLVAMTVLALAAGLAPIEVQTELDVPLGLGPVLTAAVLALCVVLPFTDRRGISR